ncbi:MAG: hypothetical protein K2X84_00650 [Beijerinckiaceae bacterium]|nr:hypothetical protein [Beijerinckiaceae bacterium]
MLARAAIRICAVQAILGRTFAGDRVLDSEISSMDETAAVDDRRPFVAVYTDEDNARDGLFLVFEIGVTARMASPDPETGDPVIADGVPLTDGEIELLIDAIQRQIAVALNEPGNAWAELYRRLFSKKTVESQRGADSRDGLRFAARQVKYVGTVQPDPPLNAPQPDGSVWKAFIAAVSASPDAHLAGKAALFEALIGVTPQDGWRKLYRLLGLSDAAHDALGRTLQDVAIPDGVVTIIGNPMADQPPGGLA